MTKRASEQEELSGPPKEALPVFEHPDPIEYIKGVLRRGYGGDITPCVLTYVAMASRLLVFKPGQMPAHIQLKGDTSSGKSFALTTTLRHMPSEAIYRMDAGSPRAFIYDEEPIEFKAVVISERDSIPMTKDDGDNPAASAIRSLLQDGSFDYRVTVTSPGDRPRTQLVRKQGPAVLITTGTTAIEGQLGTRLFVFEMKEDRDQLNAALGAAAETELGDNQALQAPDEALLAYQRHLQKRAPWHVKIPFVYELMDAFGTRFNSSRVLRDVQRICSLVKAVALLRQHHRRCDQSGAILAEVQDYETVFELANSMYDSTVSVSPSLREIVALIDERGEATVRISAQEAADELRWARDKAKKTIRRAVAKGYLIDERSGGPRNQMYALTLGEPLPESCGLPTLDEVRTARTKWGPQGVPVETQQNKQFSLQWVPGTPDTETPKGAIAAASSPPDPTCTGSQGPTTNQVATEESLGVGPPGSPSDAPASAISANPDQEEMITRHLHEWFRFKEQLLAEVADRSDSE